MKHWLSGLPESTDAWTCPYFLTICFLGSLVIVASFLDGPPILDVLAVVSALLLGYVVAMRQTGSCDL